MPRRISCDSPGTVWSFESGPWNPPRSRTWARRDSNPEPKDYESSALTVELRARNAPGPASRLAAVSLAQNLRKGLKPAPSLGAAGAEKLQFGQCGGCSARQEGLLLLGGPAGRNLAAITNAFDPDLALETLRQQVE